MDDKLNGLAEETDGSHCVESHRRGEALKLDYMHNVEALLMNVHLSGEQVMVNELHNLPLAHEVWDHNDYDLHDDEFDEDLALEEVWEWRDDHDIGVPDDDLYGEAPDVPHSCGVKEEVQSDQLASHDKDQHELQPPGHQGVEECHCSLHCSL